jgi:hypothetical protein
MKIRKINCDVFKLITKAVIDDETKEPAWDTIGDEYVKTITFTENDDDCKHVMKVLIDSGIVLPQDKNRTNIKMNKDEVYLYIEVFEKKKSRPTFVIREELDD